MTRTQFGNLKMSRKPNSRTSRKSPTTDEEKPKTIVQFFRHSPLVGLELQFERKKDISRDIDLFDDEPNEPVDDNYEPSHK